MARLTFDIPDAQVGRVYDAFATAYGYQEKLPGALKPNGAPGPEINNPESKAEFARRMIISFIRNVVTGVEGESAAQKARGDTARAVEREVVVN